MSGSSPSLFVSDDKKCLVVGGHLDTHLNGGNELIQNGSRINCGNAFAGERSCGCDECGFANIFKFASPISVPTCSDPCIRPKTESGSLVKMESVTPIDEAVSSSSNVKRNGEMHSSTIVSNYASSRVMPSETGTYSPYSTAQTKLNCHSVNSDALTKSQIPQPVMHFGRSPYNSEVVGLCKMNEIPMSMATVHSYHQGHLNGGSMYYSVVNQKNTQFNSELLVSDAMEMPCFETGVHLPYSSITDESSLIKQDNDHSVIMPKVKKIRLQYTPLNNNGEILSKCDVCGAEIINSVYFSDQKTRSCGKCNSVKSAVLQQNTTDAAISGNHVTTDEPSYSTVIKSEVGLNDHALNPTVERPHECKECGAKFARKGHLSTHKLLHTGERPYTCKVCGACFTHMTSLKDHTLQHTGEKPYKCDECGAAFSRKGHLNTHTLIHTGRTPYQCDICGASFTHKTSLIDHTLQHSGEKPYQCFECGATFRRKGHLNTHGIIHMREKLFQSKQNCVSAVSLSEI